MISHRVEMAVKSAELAGHRTGRIIINRAFRKECPNADRAFAAVRKLERANGAYAPLEYAHCVSLELTRIVNSQY